jgi:predicted RNA-binding protein with PUA-like domain
MKNKITGKPMPTAIAAYKMKIARRAFAFSAEVSSILDALHKTTSRMTTQYWLVKQEPEAYAWTDFVRDGRTRWEGVRNFQARNFLKAMKTGDAVLFYESVTTKAVVGIAEVSKPAFPDTTADEDGWVAVELKAGKALKKPVTLAQIKATPALQEIGLLRQSRLSVMPLKKAEFDCIVKLGK